MVEAAISTQDYRHLHRSVLIVFTVCTICFLKWRYIWNDHVSSALQGFCATIHTLQVTRVWYWNTAAPWPRLCPCSTTVQPLQVHFLSPLHYIPLHSVFFYIKHCCFNFHTLTDTAEGSKPSTVHTSVYAILNQTSTTMGSRRLKDWLLRPLTHISLIQNRYDVIPLMFEWEPDPVCLRTLSNLIISFIVAQTAVHSYFVAQSTPAGAAEGIRGTFAPVPRLREIRCVLLLILVRFLIILHFLYIPCFCIGVRCELIFFEAWRKYKIKHICF